MRSSQETEEFGIWVQSLSHVKETHYYIVSTCSLPSWEHAANLKKGFNILIVVNLVEHQHIR